MVYHLGDPGRERARATPKCVLERRELTHNIAERVPLERIDEAHERIELGQGLGQGKLVVEI